MNKNLNLNLNRKNDKINTINKHYPITNIFDQIIEASGNSHLTEYYQDSNSLNSNINNFNNILSKNSNNFTNMEYLAFNNPREKENVINSNNNKTTFYKY